MRRICTCLLAVGLGACSLVPLNGLTQGDDASVDDGSIPGDGDEPSFDDAVSEPLADASFHETMPPDAGAGSDAARDGTTPEAAQPDTALPAEASQLDTAPPADAAFEAAPPLPISFVQANAASGGATSTVLVSFNQPLQPHDAIVVGVDFDSPTAIPSITDSLGQSYQVVVSVPSSNLFIALAQDTMGGADTVTVTLPSPSTSWFEVYAHEYSGFALQGAFDVGTGATGSTTIQDGMASGFITTSTPNELIFGYGTTGSASVGTGFTARLTFDANITEDEPAPVPGSYQATATMTAGSGWTMLVAAFKGQ